MEVQTEETATLAVDNQTTKESPPETDQSNLKTPSGETDQNEISKTADTSDSENHEAKTSNDNNNVHENPEKEKELFKLPQLIKGPRLPPANYVFKSPNTDPENSTNEQTDSTGNHTNLKPETSGKSSQDKTIPFPYKEPLWSGLAEKLYVLEVLKGGMIVDAIKLDSKPYYVLGRLSTCDVMLEHPSISRYHAVLQYRSVSDDVHPSGFYLYDLGSTHGTTLNKQPVQPRIYYRLRVGYMLKFGGSTRMFILQGPEDDQDMESELTVSELKELRKKQEEQLERLEKSEEELNAEKLESDSEKDSGIDWGMGEDAVEEEEETIQEENPFALDMIAPNEELYVDDPKKTLRGWFEREGHELEYQVEEKGYSQFYCRIKLPIENSYGSPMFAEALIKGKKKEAVAACALEACRLLDRQGLLRQANHESRKRKLKNWEADDYYDSDEDTFLDRTGTIEKKRQQRIHRAGKDANVVETYDSLMSKLEQVNQEIKEIDQTITISQKSTVTEDDENVDALEAYMTSIRNDQTVDKCSRTALKMRLSQLRQEELRLKQLIEIARPATLPELKPETEKTLSGSTENKPKRPLPLIGSMKSRGIKTRLGAPPVKKPPVKETMISQIVLTENISDERKYDDSSSKEKIDSPQNAEIEEKTQENGGSAEKDKPQENEQKKTVPESSANSTSKSNLPPIKHSKSRRKKYKSELNYVYDSTNPDYAMWIPPENQSGDGRTSLNDKYGY